MLRPIGSRVVAARHLHATKQTLQSANRFSFLKPQANTVSSSDDAIPEQSSGQLNGNRFAQKFNSNGRNERINGNDRTKRNETNQRSFRWNSDRDPGRDRNNWKLRTSNFNESRPRQRREMFQLTTGSEFSQSALKDLIRKVEELETKYVVNYLNPDSNQIQEKHLEEITNKLNLEEEGLLLIVKENDLPLVRHIKVVDMVKSYSEELAQKKQQELLESGNSAALRAAHQRMKQEHKKSAEKSVTLYFSISVSDLVNQKKREMTKFIESGTKFIIYLTMKRPYFSSKKSSTEVDSESGSKTYDIRNAAKFRDDTGEVDEDLFDIELAKRQLILDNLVKVLDEFGCTYNIEGAIHNRMKIDVTPKEVPKEAQQRPQASSSKKVKEKKEKRSKEPAKTKKSEEDLDALYSFKIED
ncbi:mitochondrial translation initiation factor-domain-containing protein [Scheffersomyces amazonensis]|uniref:mitochondrial translation initiation factor-domain-containing protein n=1 Tax=Scheffersomyces amazonensis TaxID=1078765 RepID=UPI00315D1382